MKINTSAIVFAIFAAVGANTGYTAEGDTADDQVIEEVLVTATRRTENLQDVPISISAIQAEDIVATGSVDLQDVALQIPNLVFAESVNQGLAFISIRGINSRTEPSDIGFDSSVGVYVDGVFHSRQFNANANMGEVERVEVLRGPQGTLFGRNTISGAISITSKKPTTDEVLGNVSVDVGDRDMVHVRGSVNVPLIDGALAVKVFAESYDIDGYATNITTGNRNLGAKEKTSARFQLRYTPNDQTTVDLSVSAYNSESEDYFFEHVDGPASDGRQFTTTNNTENTSKIELFNTSLAIEHEFANGYTLTSTSAWLDDELNFGADVEATATPVIGIESVVTTEQFSQELRVASPADRHYDFIAGFYYNDETGAGPDEIFVGAGFPFPPVQGSSIKRGGNTLDREALAVFAHANYDLNDQATLFGGARYTDETKKQKTLPSTCENFFTCVILGNPALTTVTDAPVDVTMEEWTFTAGLRYHVNQDIMVYGSVGTGIKSGAFNNTANPEADFASNNLITNPEEVTSYELGVKSSWPEHHLNVNLAVFFMDYDDLQVRLGCVDCGPGGIPLRFMSNAGTASGQGFELELVSQPTDSLRLTAGVGFMDTTYDNLTDVEDQRRGGFFDAGGKKLPLAPEWTINAALQHTTEMAGGILTSRLDLSYVDDRFSDGSFHNHPDDILPSQTLLGARISFRPVEDGWGIALWGKNLTDDDSMVYRAFGSAFLPFGTNRAQYQEPRTYGVTLDLRF